MPAGHWPSHRQGRICCFMLDDLCWMTNRKARVASHMSADVWRSTRAGTAAQEVEKRLREGRKYERRTMMGWGAGQISYRLVINWQQQHTPNLHTHTATQAWLTFIDQVELELNHLHRSRLTHSSCWAYSRARCQGDPRAPQGDLFIPKDTSNRPQGEPLTTRRLQVAANPLQNTTEASLVLLHCIGFRWIGP